MNDGLKIRDVAMLLDVHENTVRHMMEDHRLEWYYLNGRHGVRRVRASSVKAFMQKGMVQDWCGLCPYPLSKHTAATEEVVVNGQKGVRPIGWACPRPSEVAAS